MIQSQLLEVCRALCRRFLPDGTFRRNVAQVGSIRNRSASVLMLSARPFAAQFFADCAAFPLHWPSAGACRAESISVQSQPENQCPYAFNRI
jgi:hypothetical protein